MMKRKSNYIDCCAMLTEVVAKIIIPLHVISGSDHTSSFCGHGKKKFLEKVVSDHEAKEMLSRVAENLEVEDKVKVDMQSFVLSKLYSESRPYMWTRQGFQVAEDEEKEHKSPPPDDDTLKHHLERTNYITYCQVHYSSEKHPSPIGHGWAIVNGKCRPVRHTLPLLADQLKRHCEDDGSDDDSSTDADDESTDSDSD